MGAEDLTSWELMGGTCDEAIYRECTNSNLLGTWLSELIGVGENCKGLEEEYGDAPPYYRRSFLFWNMEWT